jgi:hypothetical protein
VNNFGRYLVSCRFRHDRAPSVPRGSPRSEPLANRWQTAPSP